MARYPIDSLDGATGNRAGAGGRGGRIYLRSSDSGLIQRNAPRSDKVADPVQIALRIRTQIFVEQHQYARIFQTSLASA